MKKFHLLMVSFLFASITLLTGCVSSSDYQMQSLNKSLRESNSPTRLIKTKATDKYDQYQEEWAGKPGNSVAFSSKLLTSDIFKTIEKNCGLKASQLIETRIVSHKYPEFNEVWVFKDPLSKRKDGLSGLTVFLKQTANNNGTDFFIHGKCHSTQMNFTFGK